MDEKDPPYSDEYGFDPPETYDPAIHAEYLAKCQVALPRRAAQWDKLRGDYTRCPRLKRMVRKGIPSSLRCEVWMSVSGAKDLLSQHPDKYLTLIETVTTEEGITHYKLAPPKPNGTDDTMVDIIKRDLHRTFPENPRFVKDGEVYGALQDVLVAFSLYRPEIGYCQGLNYIAGILLLATQVDTTQQLMGTEGTKELQPEKCFWLLVALMNLLPDYHSAQMKCLNSDITVVDNILNKRVPQTMKHVSSFGLPQQVFLTKWFVCLFIDLLPVHTVLRVWDCLFYEGYKIIFRTCVAMFILHKQDLKAVKDMSQLAQCFKQLFWDNAAWDSDRFMKLVFRKSGRMPLESLEVKREGALKEVEK